MRRFLFFVFVLLLALTACATQRGPSATPTPTETATSTPERTVCSVNASRISVTATEGDDYTIYTQEGRNSIRTMKVVNEGLLNGYGGEGENSLVLFDGKYWQVCQDWLSTGPSGHVNAITIWHGRLFVGTDRSGLFEYATGNLWIRHTKAIENSISDDRIYTLEINEEDQLAIGHYEGVDSLDAGNQFSVRLNYLMPRSKRATHALLFNDDEVWRGTISGGLDHWDGSKWKHYGESELGSDNIRSIVLGADNSVWVGTDGGGVAQWKSDVWTRFETPSLTVMQVLFDQYDRPWIATSKGAYYLEGDQWMLYGKEWQLLSLAFGIEDGVFTPDKVFLGSDGFGLIAGEVPEPLK